MTRKKKLDIQKKHAILNLIALSMRGMWSIYTFYAVFFSVWKWIEAFIVWTIDAYFECTLKKVVSKERKQCRHKVIGVWCANSELIFHLVFVTNSDCNHVNCVDFYPKIRQRWRAIVWLLVANRVLWMIKGCSLFCDIIIHKAHTRYNFCS